jgi:Tfp pilus assembly protein PilE
MLELLAVVAIVLILGTISVVSFAQLSRVLENHEARSAVDRVVMAERNWASKNISWTQEPGNLSVGRNVTATTGVSGDAKTVSVAVERGTRLGLAAMSSSGECQAKVLGDPVGSREESWVTIPAGMSCSGASALLGS